MSSWDRYATDDYAHRAITVVHHDDTTGRLVLSFDTGG